MANKKSGLAEPVLRPPSTSARPRGPKATYGLTVARSEVERVAAAVKVPAKDVLAKLQESIPSALKRVEQALRGDFIKRLEQELESARAEPAEQFED